MTVCNYTHTHTIEAASWGTNRHIALSSEVLWSQEAWTFFSGTSHPVIGTQALQLMCGTCSMPGWLCAKENIEGRVASFLVCIQRCMHSKESTLHVQRSPSLLFRSWFGQATVWEQEAGIKCMQQEKVTEPRPGKDLRGFMKGNVLVGYL